MGLPLGKSLLLYNHNTTHTHFSVRWLHKPVLQRKGDYREIKVKGSYIRPNHSLSPCRWSLRFMLIDKDVVRVGTSLCFMDELISLQVYTEVPVNQFFSGILGIKDRPYCDSN